ncbi:DUF2259 domain-containing protein [Roseibium sp.]|uniref:DUF2259 domain-containing protein n=1 Tax=Roseibium sp. TaxID=1936156 RepID=UPI003A97501F
MGIFSRACAAVFGTLLATTIVSTVHAGDFADIDIIGFSKDGRRFAFEQYGIQDGSGFPYSEVFVIDVQKDSWVKPSPFKFVEQNVPDGIDQDTILGDTRHVAIQAAHDSGLLDGIDYPGQTVGANPVTEVSADPHLMVVNPRIAVPAFDDPMEFSIEEYPLEAGKCASYGAQTRGFRLTMLYQGMARVLNEDKDLPESRGCPLSYRIERVITRYPDAGPPVFAALILMQTHGFEGPDGRYLAITGRF